MRAIHRIALLVAIAGLAACTRSPEYGGNAMDRTEPPAATSPTAPVVTAVPADGEPAQSALRTATFALG